MNRVLIIEDEIDTAQPVKEALALESIEADIARNGEQGIELFRTNNYDLILLDLKMPGMDGEEVLSVIRKEDPYVDVIVYTNYTEFADIKKLTNIGIDGYFNKGPEADLDELIECIKRKLAPLSEDQLEKLIEKTPESFLRETMMSKVYLLDTNALFNYIKYKVKYASLDLDLQHNIDELESNKCYISEITTVEIVSVLGKYARGGLGAGKK